MYHVDNANEPDQRGNAFTGSELHVGTVGSLGGRNADSKRYAGCRSPVAGVHQVGNHAAGMDRDVRTVAKIATTAASSILMRRQAVCARRALGNPGSFVRYPVRAPESRRNGDGVATRGLMCPPRQRAYRGQIERNDCQVRQWDAGRNCSLEEMATRLEVRRVLLPPPPGSECLGFKILNFLKRSFLS